MGDIYILYIVKEAQKQNSRNKNEDSQRKETRKQAISRAIT